MQENINKCDAIGKKTKQTANNTCEQNCHCASAQSDQCPWCSLQLS